jgi:hypothetical protein
MEGKEVGDQDQMVVLEGPGLGASISTLGDDEGSCLGVHAAICGANAEGVAAPCFGFCHHDKCADTTSIEMKTHRSYAEALH